MKLKSDERRISRHFKELYCLEIVVPAEKKWDITELRFLPCFFMFLLFGNLFQPDTCRHFVQKGRLGCCL